MKHQKSMLLVPAKVADLPAAILDYIPPSLLVFEFFVVAVAGEERT